MAEAGQALAYADFQRYVGRYLGLDRTTSNWSTNETNEVDDIIQAGYRKFLNPPDLGNGSYEWSFLRPTTTFVAWTDVTGTVSGSATYDATTNKSTITATTSKFYGTMPGNDFTFDTSDTDYEITDYVSGTQVMVSGDASGEASGDTFTITATGNYTLPDDFGGIMECLFFDTDNNYQEIVERPEGHILQGRSMNVSSGIPRAYAIRPKSSTGASGQRFEILLFPTPSSDYTLTYKYVTLRDKMDATSYPYPLGGAAHSQTVLAAIMAEAEWEERMEEGPAYRRFIEALRASVSHDSKAMKALRLGYNGDPGTTRRVYRGGNYRVSFGGTYYP